MGNAANVRRFAVSLAVAGAHNVANALAAVAAGLAVGVGEGAIRAGLARYRPTGMRSEVRRWRGVTVLNDCYNANPASMRAALRWLTEARGTGRAIAVLGDMLELGGETRQAHRNIGVEAARLGTDYLLTVGELAADIADGALGEGMPAGCVITAKDHDTVAKRLRGILHKGDVVLLKGSRGARMEQVLEGL
jgi:UDP-N-acetylmuramoyl-tripeptide--D-alanyl-D-alanine ligase